MDACEHCVVDDCFEALVINGAPEKSINLCDRCVGEEVLIVRGHFIFGKVRLNNSQARYREEIEALTTPSDDDTFGGECVCLCSLACGQSEKWTRFEIATCLHNN